MRNVGYNEVIIPINELKQFIEEQLIYSPNKVDYISAVDDLENSEDISKVQAAIIKIKSLASELGRNIIIKGISALAIEAIKSI